MRLKVRYEVSLPCSSPFSSSFSLSSVLFTLRVSKFTFLHNVAAAAGVRDRCASLTYFLHLVFPEPPLESIFTPCPSLPPLQRQSRST